MEQNYILEGPLGVRVVNKLFPVSLHSSQQLGMDTAIKMFK